MMWLNWKTISWAAMTAERLFSGGGHIFPLEVKRAAVRRMNLRLDMRGRAVRLTLPRFVPLGPALKWVDEKRDWVEMQLAKLPSPSPIVPGMVVPLGDEALTLDWAESYPRRVVRIGDQLRVGGPLEALPGRLTRWLKRQALERLEAESRAMAAEHGLPLTSVGVGDPTSRWGSCSSSGAIRYSWRLILAPDFVLKATVAHELAHLKHMDHSPRFYAVLRELLGNDPKPARDWLKAHGQKLHGFGRG
jgi:predicted metal-dependent hydrolase